MQDNIKAKIKAFVLIKSKVYLLEKRVYFAAHPYQSKLAIILKPCHANQWNGFRVNVSLDWHGLIWVIICCIFLDY